jgi:hypothetical protein
MDAVRLAVALLGLTVPPVSPDSGLSHSRNFVVSAPHQSLADDVLSKAEQFRREIAQTWLGDELPPSVGRTIVHVERSATADGGRTWLIDGPDRKYHMVWLNSTRDQVRAGALQHEICHVVLGTQYPGRVPAWADEGIASSYDDSERVAARRRMIEWFTRTGNWPNVEFVLQTQSIQADNHEAYSVAASLAEFLVERAGRGKFVSFAVAGRAEGWDRALQRHYGIRNVATLESRWQDWAIVRHRNDSKRPITPTAPAH